MSTTKTIPGDDLKYEKVPTQALINEDVPDAPVKKYGYGIRHIQAIIIMLSLTLSYATRSHLGMTIVAMTNIPKHTIQNSTFHIVNNQTLDNVTEVNENQTNYNNFIVNTTAGSVYAEINDNITDYKNEDMGIYRLYDWPKATQEMVLGAFFLGYCLAMLPFGVVTQRWGGKLPLQISLFINTIMSVGSPWFVLWGGWKAICICRICQGVAQAGTYPAIQTLLAQWVPASELATFASFVFTGSTVGTVIGFQMSGFLVSSSLGWPSPFWVSGGLCFTGFCLMTMFGAATPNEHKLISQEEKDFILGHIGGEKTVKRPKVPVKAILSNKHVWATFTAHSFGAMAYVFFLTQLPSYLHFILKFNVKDSGIVSSLPFVVNFFVSIMSGWLSDYFINKNIFEVKTTRRIMNSIGFIIPAASSVMLTYSTNTILGVFFLITIMGSHATTHSGWLVNYIDMSPKFSGTLTAIGNTICNACVLILPVLVSNIVTDVRNVYQWRRIFYLMSTSLVFACVVFFFFLSTEIQPFNNSSPSSEPEVLDENDDLNEIAEFQEKKLNTIRRKSLTIGTL